MQPKRIIPIHFSGTRTTKKIVDGIVRQFDAPVQEYDLREVNPSKDETLGPDDLAVVGMPVYSGRIPAIARTRLDWFRGNGTPAIAVAVYGNRAYDDALVELVDVLSGSGFTVFAAAAFVAEHSIFPKVAAGRPDAADMELVAQFAKTSSQRLAAGLSGSYPVKVKGNRPYLEPPKAGLRPTVDEGSCILCSTCVRVCPSGALFMAQDGNGIIRNEERCVPCSACIKVCPAGSQAYRGEKYEAAGRMFEEKFSARLEPETFI